MGPPSISITLGVPTMMLADKLLHALIGEDLDRALGSGIPTYPHAIDFADAFLGTANEVTAVDISAIQRLRLI